MERSLARKPPGHASRDRTRRSPPTRARDNRSVPVTINLTRMLRELIHFVRSAPSAGRLRNRMSPAEHLDRVEQHLDRAGKAHWRAKLVEGLAGEILEIGAGSGTMFEYYRPGVRVTALEPNDGLRAMAAERARKAAVSIELRAGLGEVLPFPDASFDGVVCVSVLCCVRSVEEVVRQIRRVLKPGGALRLIEHVKSEGVLAGALQDLFNPVWLKMNRQGCNMNRDPRPLLRDLGFRIVESDSFQVFVPEMPAAFVNQVIKAIRT